jgi:hypothetical protein
VSAIILRLCSDLQALTPDWEWSCVPPSAGEARFKLTANRKGTNERRIFNVTEQSFQEVPRSRILNDIINLLPHRDGKDRFLKKEGEGDTAFFNSQQQYEWLCRRYQDKLRQVEHDALKKVSYTK